MIDSQLLYELRSIVGESRVSTSRAGAEVYSYDASLAVAVPDATVLPADTDEVAGVVRAATAARVPYVPRGFGTNLSGGSIAAAGGLVIEMSRLNRILEICPEGRYAVVQPGVTNMELQTALAPLGMFYAPDPASQKVATLGGNVGENSGGPHCLKYGVTSNHVLGLTAVLPGGEVIRTGGAALDPPGYDIRGLLIGSEGTLGIVTEVVVRILPSPESVITMLAIYDDNADAARSVSDIIAAGIVPATLEMMDATVIQAVEDSKSCGYPRDAAAVLIAEVDGPETGLADQAERIRELCMENGCREVRRAKDAAERDLLWAGRRGAFGAIARLAPNYLVADCTVPRNRLPDALAKVEEIAGSYELSHGNVFHAGDGNLHPLLLFDSRNEEQLHRVHEAGREIMEACVGLGGTITGEHGIGVEKAEAMRLIFSDDDLRLQRSIRDAVDPDDLLNPGKILPSGTGDDNEKVAEKSNGEPSEAFAPTDVDEACVIVRQANADRTALIPVGSGLQGNVAAAGEKTAIPIRTIQLDSIVEYDPANQVIAAEAGMSLDTLQETVAENNQWLPIRPPLGRTGTLGGLVAAAVCGPERLRYGAPRDLLLGLKFVSPQGRAIDAGGRVVKNVAGYDITRLMTGSRGTLGLLTELTFRVLPRPETCVAVEATGTLGQCATAATELLLSKLEPIFVVGMPKGDDSWTLTAGFEGFEETVRFQAEHCEDLVQKSGLAEATRNTYDLLDGVCGERFSQIAEKEMALRIDLPLSAVGGFVAGHRGLLGQETFVDFGCGRVSAGLATIEEDVWTRIGDAVKDAGGHAIVERFAKSLEFRYKAFGPQRSDWRVMHRIKAALDPRGIFAPGGLPGE